MFYDPKLVLVLVLTTLPYLQLILHSFVFTNLETLLISSALPNFYTSFGLLIFFFFLKSMASQYSLLEYDSNKEQERYASIPLSNLSSAALFITGLLEQAGILYSLMGGPAVRFMGGSCATHDVDIAFQAPRKMRDLWRIVDPEPRYANPPNP